MSKRYGYVYVLHFERPLCHSQHYIGCTCSPRTRLETHAIGRGARIVEAAAEAGIGFRLGALGVCNLATMHRLERQLKDMHGAAAYCECCAKMAGWNPKAIPGTMPYCLESIAWPLTSRELGQRIVKHDVRVRFTTDQDTLALARSMQKLMQANKHALGFIPAGGDQGVGYAIAAGRVVVAHMCGQLVGFTLFTETSEMVRIHQVVVEDTERGSGIGRMMVDHVRFSRPGVVHRAAVRDELAANGFWQAIGFTLSGAETHATSGSKLNIYTHTSTNEDTQSCGTTTTAT